MFRWIIGSSLKFRVLVIGVASALLVFGTGQLRRMPVDVFPEFAQPNPNKIKRENNSRRIDVHANVKGRDLGSVADEVNESPA